VSALWFALALAAVAFATQPVAYDLHAFKVAVALLAGSLTLLLAPAQRALERALGGALRAWALWLALLAASAAVAIFSTGFDARGAATVRELLLAVLFVVVAAAVRESAWPLGPRIASALLVVAAAAAAVALAQPFGVDLVYGAATKRAAVGTFGNTNACAAFLAPLLPLALARTTARGASRWLAAAAVVVIGGALLVARARGGWIAAAAGVAVVFVARRRAGAPLGLAAVALAAGLALGFAAQQSAASAPELAAKPLGLGLERTSNVVRLDVARGTAALASHHLLLGVGPGGFRDAYFEHRPEREARTPTRGGYASDVDHPHCEPLRQLAEGGAAGLLVFLLALLATWRSLLAARGAARDDDGRLRAGLLGALAAWGVSGLFWSTLYDPPTLLLGALLVGLSLAGEDGAEPRVPRTLLRLPVTALLVVAGIGYAQATLRAERVEWAAARDNTLDRADLAAIAEAAATDSLNFDRNYSVARKEIEAAALSPDGGDEFLARARDCLRRALALLPDHVAARLSMAEARVRGGDEKGARAELERAHRLEPWRGAVAPALAQLLIASGRPYAAARARLEVEGDAAVAPLRELAQKLLAAGRTRDAAQVLDLLSERTPDDGELARELSLAMQALDDSDGFARAQRRAQLSYAVIALSESRSEDARENLRIARRYAPPPAALEELLEACVDAQRNRVEDAARRLAALETESGAEAWRRATPRQLQVLRFLLRVPALAPEAQRFGAER
jgi:O-antigen ligase